MWLTLLFKKNFSAVLNVKALLSSLVLIKNSIDLPVPLMFLSLRPLTKLAPSRVPTDKPTLNDPVWVSSTLIFRSSVLLAFLELFTSIFLNIVSWFKFLLIFLSLVEFIGSPSTISNSLLIT